MICFNFNMLLQWPGGNIMPATEPTINEDLIRNPNQRTACVLVLDASGSMKSMTASGRARIQELNDGLRIFEAELKKDPTAKVRVQVSIVCVGGPAGEREADIMQEWTDAVRFQAFDLTASGETPLGKGMEIALRVVEDQKLAYKAAGIGYTRPWIIVITDGEPTDEAEWERAVAACHRAEHENKCVIWPIGVEGVNVSKLQRLTSNRVQLVDEVKFKELFKWLSTSLRALSRAAPGEEIQTPSTDAWVAVKA